MSVRLPPWERLGIRRRRMRAAELMLCMLSAFGALWHALGLVWGRGVASSRPVAGARAESDRVSGSGSVEEAARREHDEAEALRAFLAAVKDGEAQTASAPPGETVACRSFSPAFAEDDDESDAESGQTCEDAPVERDDGEYPDEDSWSSEDEDLSRDDSVDDESSLSWSAELETDEGESARALVAKPHEAEALTRQWTLADLAAMRGSIQGVLLDVSPEMIRGQAWDWARPDQAVTVEIDVDGRSIGRFLADRPLGFDRFGTFEIPFPKALSDGQAHIVDGYACDSRLDRQVPLQCSPHTVIPWASPGGLRDTARQALALGAHSSEASPLAVRVMVGARERLWFALANADLAHALAPDAETLRESEGGPLDPASSRAWNEATLAISEGEEMTIQEWHDEGDDPYLRRWLNSETLNSHFLGWIQPGIAFASPYAVAGLARLYRPGAVQVWIDGRREATFQGSREWLLAPSNDASLSGERRPDLEWRFRYELPWRVRDGQAHILRVFADMAPSDPKYTAPHWQELNGSPRIILHKPHRNVQGYLDCRQDGFVEGWAFDPDTPGRPVQVELWYDNEFWALVEADQPRKDLELVTPSADCAFKVEIPYDWSSYAPHTIRAFARDTGDGGLRELRGSPLGGQPVWDREYSSYGLWRSNIDHMLLEYRYPRFQHFWEATIDDGDLLKAIDGHRAPRDLDTLRQWLNSCAPGRRWSLTVLRPTPSPPPERTELPPECEAVIADWEAQGHTLLPDIEADAATSDRQGGETLNGIPSRWLTLVEESHQVYLPDGRTGRINRLVPQKGWRRWRVSSDWTRYRELIVPVSLPNE